MAEWMAEKAKPSVNRRTASNDVMLRVPPPAGSGITVFSKPDPEKVVQGRSGGWL
jgi:hypothetical protein